MEDWQVLDLLSLLVEKSLVVYEETAEGQGRYRMLETLRQYSRDRLYESGESEQVRDRHQQHFSELVYLSQGKLIGRDARLWLDRFHTEHDNLRVAMEWLPDGAVSPQARTALQIACRLTMFWQFRGFVGEGRAYLHHLLSVTENDAQAEPLRADALNGVGLLALTQGDLIHAGEYQVESARLYRERGDKSGEANALWAMGNIEYYKGDLTAARACYESALVLFEEVGDVKNVSRLSGNLGTLAMSQGDLDGAEKSFTLVVTFGETMDHHEAVLHALHNLGYVSYHRGDWSKSRRFYERSLSLARQVGNKQGIAYTSGSLANTLLRQNDLAGARITFNEGLGLSQESGDKPYIALLLESGADLALAEQNPLRATRLLGAAEVLREKLQIPLPPDERADYERTLAAACDTVNDEAAFQNAWNTGRSMTLEDAVQDALGEADD